MSVFFSLQRSDFMKFLKITGIFILSAFLISANSLKIYNVVLYPLNKSDMSLCEIHDTIYASNINDLSQKILKKLIHLQNENEYIKIIPPDTTVSASNTTAIVNFPDNIEAVLENKTECELFTIYSLVNSLTSAKDIITVEFTIDNKKQKELFGFTDMRESFIPDYEICS